MAKAHQLMTKATVSGIRSIQSNCFGSPAELIRFHCQPCTQNIHKIDIYNEQIKHIKLVTFNWSQVMYNVQCSQNGHKIDIHNEQA